MNKLRGDILQIYVEQLISIIQTIIHDSVVVYFIYSLIYYLLGGVDESILTLIMLQGIYIVACYLSKLKVCYTFIIKVYLTIMVGALLDRTFHFDSSSLRMYLILYYTYNTLVDVLNVLSLDKFKIPKGLKKMIGKIKKE